MMTNQQLADKALHAWQERGKALGRGDYAEARKWRWEALLWARMMANEMEVVG